MQTANFKYEKCDSNARDSIVKFHVSMQLMMENSWSKMKTLPSSIQRRGESPPDKARLKILIVPIKEGFDTTAALLKLKQQ
jgi:hypothetical protein